MAAGKVIVVNQVISSSHRGLARRKSGTHGNIRGCNIPDPMMMSAPRLNAAPSQLSLQGVRVFISYPRGGSTHTWAERVHADLAERGATVWRDELGIVEGDDDWYVRIEQGLTRSDVLAFVVGTDTQDSRWQRRELLMADNLALPVVAFRTAKVALPFYAIEKQPVELRDVQKPEASFASLAKALAHSASRTRVADDQSGNSLDPFSQVQRQQELEYLQKLVFGELSDREERYEPLAGKERESLPLARSHKSLRTDLCVLFRAFGKVGASTPDIAPKPWADVLDAYRSLPSRRFRRLAVLGEPGAGKTFSLERIACYHARQALDSMAAPLPILLRLGRWTRDDEPLQTFLERELGALGRYFPALRDQRRALLLLDGLNEIPPAQRFLKAEQILQLAQDERFAAVVLSCRQRDFESDFKLPFDTLTLQPLTPQQVYRYLQRAYTFDKGTELGPALAEERFWQIAGGEPLREVWSLWQQAGASFDQFWAADDIPRKNPNVHGKTKAEHDRLWRKARQDNRTLLRLAGNPYLLFVMMALPSIPSNRAALFDGFLALLYERERTAREAQHDALRVPTAADWLNSLAEVAEALQRLHLADTDEFDIFGAATSLPRSNLPPSMTQAMLEFSIDANVLQQVGDEFCFTHQLLQEALASKALLQAICDGSRQANRFWPHDRWWYHSGWEVVAEISAESCAEDFAARWRLLGWLADANPRVACDAWRSAGAPALPASLADAIAGRWLPRLDDPQAEPATVARALIGHSLAGFNLRHGVGLRRDGLPEIDWVTIRGDQPFYFRNGLWLTLPTFQIARYPVTHRQFQAFVDAGGYADDRWWQGYAHRPQRPNIPSWADPSAPRETVSWYEAAAYCRWLGAELGCDVRLPTEQQWVRAARGFTQAEYPWGAVYRAGCANCDEKSSRVAGGTYVGRTTPVGIFPFPSVEGVHDLTGNVWEWCLNPPSDPVGLMTANSATRVLCGGSWSSDIRALRDASCTMNSAEYRSSDVGFRVCRV